VRAALALCLFVAVLTLVVWRPRGLSVGWPAAAGGALAVALGLVSIAQVGRVFGLVWDATLTFVAVVLISLVLDGAGVFEWAALHMVRRAGGRGRYLFVLTIVLGAAVSALFTNDGAALILTPIIYEQARALRMDARAVLAFVMAGGFVADATSLPLVVSNLVNILSADYFHIGFVGYAVRMLPVDAAALAASLAVLCLLYWRHVPVAVGEADRRPAAAIRDPALFHLAWPTLLALVVGYVLSDVLHLPVSAVAGAAAIVLLAAARRSPAVHVRALIFDAPWGIIVFALGMYVVVFALRDAHLVSALAGTITWAAGQGRFAAVLYTGYLAAVLSSVANNLPGVLMGALSITASHAPASSRLDLALANVVGSDLGPKMTPIGSLATLLWLQLLERRGVRITWGTYMRAGVVLTVPVLFVTLCALTLLPAHG
jgi:arsenical pump membrane protein